jgi:hypothetical protein
MQSLRKGTRKPNHTFRKLRVIANCEHELRNVFLSASNILDATLLIAYKFNIWAFLEKCVEKVQFPLNPEKIYRLFYVKAIVHLS